MAGNPNMQKLGKRKTPSAQPKPDWMFAGAKTTESTAKPQKEATQKKQDKELAKYLLKRQATGGDSSKPTPPSQLLESIDAFLSEHQFAGTSSAFKTERKGRPETTEETTSVPSLSTIYSEWLELKGQKKSSTGTKPIVAESVTAPIKKSKDAKKTKSEKQRAKAKTPEPSSSDTSDTSDISSDDSDVEMEDAPANKGSSSRSSSSSSASSSSSSSSDSDADDEKEAPKAKSLSPKPKANALKRKASPDSSSKNESQKTKKAKVEVSSSSESDSSSSSSDSDSSSSDSDSSSEEESSKKKKGKQNSSSPGSGSSSSSDSDSSSDSSSDSDSDSDSSTNSLAKKTPLPDSSSDSSDSEEDTDEKPAGTSDTSATLSDDPKKLTSSSDTSSDEEEPKSKGAAAQSGKTTKNRKLSPPLPPDPVAKPAKKQNVPFSRIPKDTVVDGRLASNAYVPYDYAQKAHEDLIVTKGKGFTKEKNKKKRGSYRGGFIDVEGKKGIKFDD